jgi:serine/threonine-protein kinase
VDPVAQLNSALTDRYAVQREIGAGGMATVYLARDIKHDRNVALKVLNPELGAVLGVERFLSEIKVTANLQHPNLLPLFDSGAADGLLFYVMPFVDGESLRAKLDREKQLPIDEAIRIAVAIASALDYAHKHGVIHRDLKPENILLQAGQPVVADFGIALAVSNAGGARVTQTGLSLGTPQYMSPEQATGDRVIDGRSDIYSLAAMTYEMLTGEPPHSGNTMQAVIARVLTERPRSVRSMRPNVPEHVERALEHALEKLPADRWATAHEFADALQGRGMLPAPTGVHASPAADAVGSAGRRSARAAQLPWIVALGATAIVALWGWLGRPHPTSQVPVRFTLRTTGSAARFDAATASMLAISADGRRVVYVGTLGGTRKLYVRAIDELDARAVEGTSGSYTFPAISPDGKWVAYSALGGLMKVSLDGGQPIRLATVLNFNGASWESNESLIVAASDGAYTALSRISAAGGPLTTFAHLDTASHEAFQAMPVVIADKALVLYVSLQGAAPNGGHLAVVRMGTAMSTILDIPANRPLGFFAGHIIYAQDDGALMAVPFDPKTIRVTGSPVPLLQGVLSVNYAAMAALSASGTLVYAQGANTGELVLVDEHGGTTPIVREVAEYGHPRLSPDGKRLAVDVINGGGTDIWTYDMASGTPTRLTTARSNDRPEWTTDGRRILFLSDRDRGSGEFAVWSQPADGSAGAELLYRGSNPVREAFLTSDGQTLVFREDTPNSSRDIRMVSLDKKAAPTPLVATNFNELMPRLSPDGHWLAYMADESGKSEIYVRPFPGGGARSTVSNGGGTEPLWSRDGRKLFYRNGEQLVAATYSTASGFTVTSRDVLFAGNFAVHSFHPNFDVAPDGRHFVMIKQGDDETQVVVIVNWVEELRARLAGKK